MPGVGADALEVVMIQLDVQFGKGLLEVGGDFFRTTLLPGKGHLGLFIAQHGQQLTRPLGVRTGLVRQRFDHRFEPAGQILRRAVHLGLRLGDRFLGRRRALRNSVHDRRPGLQHFRTDDFAFDRLLASLGDVLGGQATCGLAAKIIIHRMAPFVGQRAGAAGLGQIDHHLARLIVRGRCAATAGPKGNTQFAIETDRFRRDSQHAREIHQPVIGFVQILLTILVVGPVAKLTAPETKRLENIIAGHVPAGTIVRSGALHVRAERPLQLLTTRRRLGLIARPCLGILAAGEVSLEDKVLALACNKKLILGQRHFPAPFPIVDFRPGRLLVDFKLPLPCLLLGWEAGLVRILRSLEQIPVLRLQRLRHLIATEQPEILLDRFTPNLHPGKAVVIVTIAIFRFGEKAGYQCRKIIERTHFGQFRLEGGHQFHIALPQRIARGRRRIARILRLQRDTVLDLLYQHG